MQFKYDLPVVNQPCEFENMTALIELDESDRTPVMNLYDELELDKESSFEQYVLKVNAAYNHEIDMYGDIQVAGVPRTGIRVMDFGVPIPHNELNNELVMSDMRNTFRFNQDIPGAIENVHPNKFLSNI